MALHPDGVAAINYLERAEREQYRVAMNAQQYPVTRQEAYDRPGVGGTAFALRLTDESSPATISDYAQAYQSAQESMRQVLAVPPSRMGRPLVTGTAGELSPPIDNNIFYRPTSYQATNYNDTWAQTPKYGIPMFKMSVDPVKANEPIVIETPQTPFLTEEEFADLMEEFYKKAKTENESKTVLPDVQ